jgi:hypothetical protein
VLHGASMQLLSCQDMTAALISLCQSTNLRLLVLHGRPPGRQRAMCGVPRDIRDSRARSCTALRACQSRYREAQPTDRKHPAQSSPVFFCSKIRIHDLTRKKGLTAWGPAALRTMADEDGGDPDNTRLYQVLGVDKSVRSATAAPPRASSCIHPHLKATPMQRKECDETAQQKNRVVWWPRTGGHCHPAVPHLRESTATVPSVNTPFSFVVTLPKARRGMLLQRVLRRVNLCCGIFILFFPAVCLWWRVATWLCLSSEHKNTGRLPTPPSRYPLRHLCTEQKQTSATTCSIIEVHRAQHTIVGSMDSQEVVRVHSIQLGAHHLPTLHTIASC